MVTNIKYSSFKGIDFSGRVPFALLLLVPLLFAIVLVDPPLIILSIGVVYALSGPVQFIVGRIRKS